MFKDNSMLKVIKKFMKVQFEELSNEELNEAHFEIFLLDNRVIKPCIILKENKNNIIAVKLIEEFGISIPLAVNKTFITHLAPILSIQDSEIPLTEEDIETEHKTDGFMYQ